MNCKSVVPYLECLIQLSLLLNKLVTTPTQPHHLPLKKKKKEFASVVRRKRTERAPYVQKLKVNQPLG